MTDEEDDRVDAAVEHVYAEIAEVVGAAVDRGVRATTLCRCGRARATDVDVARWREEFPDGRPHEDPPWAAAICWYNGASFVAGERGELFLSRDWRDCGRRPLEPVMMGRVSDIPVFVDVNARRGKPGDIVYYDPAANVFLVHPEDWDLFCEGVQLDPEPA